MEGFFRAADLSPQRNHTGLLVPKCGACGLKDRCLSPKMPVDGRGRRKILVVGEAPGKDEDARGKPFVGVSGKLLEDVFGDAGVDLRDDCWLTNSLICHPKGNTTPTDKQIDYCRPNLLAAVKTLQPEVIILFGKPAVKSLIGHLWKEDVGPITRWVGWRIPCREPNAWLCPTFHPAFVLRSEGKEGLVARKLLTAHVRRAVAKKGRPWKTIPDYARQVRCLYDAGEIVSAVRSLSGPHPVAFDYETDRLKPDSGGRIVTCSMSDGKTTVAFPLYQLPVLEALKDFLRGPTPKIASNLKFEDRWTRHAFGHGVRNWFWDTMLAAHVIDNRPGITGLKFQAFALLGQEDYDSYVKPYLKAAGANLPNRIKDLALDKLLKYNALDSLLEYKVAMIQRKRLGFD